ncbi:MAG: AAA family ATPase [Pyrinomonadaceae bacterium]
MSAHNSLLTSRKTSEWLNTARGQPAPEMLFGEFWLEGEMSIMFGEAGSGKSLLAVQIAQAIAGGEAVAPVRGPAKPREVLYFDLELTAKQFEMRYSRERETRDQPGRQFRFSGRFSRVEVDLTAEVPEAFGSLAEFLGAEIERMVRSSKAKVLIVDNINCLKRKYESTREALPLVAALDRIKRRYGLSILVLAHAPRRVGGRPLDISDMPGAKVLSNYADNIFAVGMSRMHPDARYLKQISPGNSARIFGEKSVPTFFLENLYGDFLGFRFRWFATEHQHLALNRDGTDWEVIYRVRSLSDAGLTIREIASKLNRSRSAVHRLLHMLPRPAQNPCVYQQHVREMEEKAKLTAKSEDEQELPSLSKEGWQPDVVDPDDWVVNGIADSGSSSVDPVPDLVSAIEITTPSACEKRTHPPLLRQGGEKGQAEAGHDDVHEHAIETPALERSFNAYGKEIWVESRNEQGKPLVWYHHDRRGRRYKNARNSLGIYVTRAEHKGQNRER